MGVKVLVMTDILHDEHLRKISEVSDSIEVRKCVERDEILRSVEDAEVVVGGITFDREIFHHAKRLRWFHAVSAGTDYLLFPEFVESPVTLTNSSGIHRAPMAEVAMAFILCLAKNLPRYMRLKVGRKWDRPSSPMKSDELTGKTLGVLGLGNVGMEVASKGKCFRMKVLALDRRAIRKPTYVDEVMGLWDLDRLLTESDYLVITVPLTSETRHMIGKRELKLMKASAYLINVSRGAVVDNKALVKALKDGWIAGAGLDVFEEEPLPESSELWAMENVMITPHISGFTPHYAERLTDIFCANLKNYLKRRPLMNMVDKKLGF